MTIYQFLLIFLGLFVFCILQTNAVLPVQVGSKVVDETSSRTCSSDLKIKLQQTIIDALDKISSPSECNGLGWTRTAFLNMSDPNEVCPSNFSTVTTPIRGCGRATNARLSCDSMNYILSVSSYSEVCGRIVAYQRGGTTAFVYSTRLMYDSIDQAYVDGLSLTHGPAGGRQHIWTFASALYENDPSYTRDWNCACTNTRYNWSYTLPSFIQNNYFCDTGNNGPGYNRNTLYSTDPLWDGEGCGASSTCCQFNSPPWFQRKLLVDTRDDIELRLCHGDSVSDQDIVISLIELYVK